MNWATQNWSRGDLKTWLCSCGPPNTNMFKNVPFADEVYGLLGSVPAKMLHVSGTGSLKHMFGCCENLINGTKSKKDNVSFDCLQCCIVREAEQQSERDFPCLSICNGITDGTKNVWVQE